MLLVSLLQAGFIFSLSGVLDLSLMAGSGLCKPSPLFSSLLWGHCLILLEIAVSPLPARYPVLGVDLEGLGRELLGNSAGITDCLVG